MSWHIEAVRHRRCPRDRPTEEMDLAAYCKGSPKTSRAADFAKFEFPRIVKEEWPTMYKLRYAMADWLYSSSAGRSAALHSTRSAPWIRRRRGREAAYASVLCSKMYDQMYKGEADRR